MSQIIAEACQNHCGDLGLLRSMVQASAEAGASYCKIQSFFAKDLSPEWFHDFDRLAKLELSWSAHEQFVNECQKYKIAPMTSVYTDKYAPMLWSVGFRHIKIGSAQAWDAELIRTYVEMGFQVLISTGGQSLASIPRIWPVMGWLHCVSEYPASPWHANLYRMLDIRKVFPSCAYGLSDHTDPKATFWDIPSKLAMTLGAKYIEKHFTLLSSEETKDGPVSINQEQLKELCRFSKLSLDEKLEEEPRFGLMVYPQQDSEMERIAKYQGRWKKESAA